MTKKILTGLLVMAFLFTSCTSHRKIEPDDDFAVDAGSEMSVDDAAAAAPSGGDELSLDDLDAPADNGTASSDIDQELENELNSLDSGNAQAQAPAAGGDELTLDEPAPVAQQEPAPPPMDVPPLVEEPVAQTPPAPVEVPVTEPQPPVDMAVGVPPVVESVPPEVMPSEQSDPAKINTVDYKGNDNGGTVVIWADRPMNYTTRLNSATNQLVLEVENSVIPNKLKRSLNTKDMASSIGSVDIYQKLGSNVTRFVVQLRPGAPEPMVQPEGNSLLIIGGGNPAMAAAPEPAPAEPAAAGRPQPTGGEDLYSDGIMSSDDLEQFLISNNKYYGKKISIQTDRMNLRDAFRFLAEESGVNMIMDTGIGGEVSLKLSNVPWDQAFVLLLKSNKLGFIRRGNVLRVARIEDIQKDEQEAVRMLEERKNKAPLIVRKFFIGYANIEELEKKITQFLTTTATLTATAAGGTAPAAPTEVVGKIISDKRTSSLIVTETEENMTRIAKLIEALDTQPPQVLIEGKVVEAKEEFARGLGVVWNSTPSSTSGGNSVNIGIDPALPPGFSVLDTDFTWGQLDVLGSLSARLLLGEREDKVRVLSSPRVSVLSNEKATIAQTAGLLIPRVEITNDGSGSLTRTFDVVQVGVTLNVTPQASNEGTVTLDLDITRSFLPRVDATVPDQRNAKTKVIVKSGETAVIGGIFESEAREANSGVPGLQNIPILGRLFRGDREGKSKNELVIFVTPTVLKPVVGTGAKPTTFE